MPGRAAALLPAALCGHAGGAAAAGGGAASFAVPLSEPTTRFDHAWEESVGSGHWALGLRADWRAQLARARAELGFKRVRMHGMLDDDMSTSLGPPEPHAGGAEAGPPMRGGYSFVNLDSVVDFLASLGMEALFEVGLMPRWLAANASSVQFHYRAIKSPPSNYTQWGEVIEAVARHLLQRYGEDAATRWYFEVWNEPNGHFWSGDPQQETYFELYRETAAAFRRASPLFRVGGPATSGIAWIPEFLAFCNASGLPPSFVSTHSYAGGNHGSIYNVAHIVEDVAKARAQAAGLPLFITEWGGTWSHEWQLDDPAYAPFLVAAVAATQNMSAVMSVWCFSDVFEEAGMPAGNVTYAAGFGLMNVYGVPKPAYRALQLLHWAGESRVPVQRAGECSTADVLALTNATHLALLITNQAPLPLAEPDPVQPCTVTVNVTGGGVRLAEATVYRIDSSHANPKQAWQRMGMPPYPTRQQLAELEAASEMVAEALPAPDASSFTLSIPRGVAGVFVPLTAP